MGCQSSSTKASQKTKEIAFNAGTRHELIRLSYEDFARLVQPKVAKFSTAEEGALRL